MFAKNVAPLQEASLLHIWAQANILKSNENWYDQVAVLNCQKNSKWFWEASEIYQLRFINAE